ncbi:MAG: tyrosine-type recombinase/integrase [Rhodopirellula sp.]|nr:tyrosine-type recombinase/integrase [Rhodopirellula sp.]
MRELSEMVGERVRIFTRHDTWHCTIQHNGRQLRRSLKTSNKKAARVRALDVERELQCGPPSRPESTTPAQVVERYLQKCEIDGLAAETIRRYTQAAHQWLALVTEKGMRSVAEVNACLMDDYCQQLVKQGCQASTIKTDVTIIRQIIKYAVSRWKLSVNPLSDYRLRTPARRPQPFWTPEETEEILKLASGDFQSQLTVLADTGLRIGELAWLTWDDFDRARNVIHIRAREGWKPKTGNIRAVPMSPRVRRILETESRDFRWVFTAHPSRQYPEGGRQISRRRMLARLKKLLARLKLPGHLHTFRHSFVSRALIANIPESIVRDWVGHIDKSILRHYSHVASQQSQAAMSNLFPQIPEKGVTSS